MAVSYNYAGPRIVEDGLILYLDSANPNSYNLSTPLTWRDISGNRNNGTLVNGTAVVSTTAGNVMSFDGVDDYVSIPNSSSISITGLYLTTSTWIKSRTLKTYAAFIHKNEQYSIAIHNNRLTYADGSDFNYSNFGFHGTFSTNIWYNIVAVKNDTNVTLYSNNAVVVSKTYGGSISGQMTSLSIGSYTNTFYSASDIAQVQIYNRALSQAEITQNYNATKGRFGL